jgi:ABC-type methionine transport system ATPase subunit
LLTEVGLGDRLEHFPNMMSGGEQQRVTIARSISNNPSILLLDEPTGDLDTKSTDIIMKILVDLNIKHKITMIMVTHDQGLKNFSNRVVKMSDGKILKILNTNTQVRQQLIDDLNQRVIDHHLIGGQGGKTQVREGISQEAVMKDAQRDGPPTIPKNFADLKNIYTTKTSVRKPSDYPILAERFVNINS